MSTVLMCMVLINTIALLFFPELIPLRIFYFLYLLQIVMAVALAITLILRV